MASTTNLNLYKPAREDYVSVTRDISDNMQKIDDGFGLLNQTKGSVSNANNDLDNGLYYCTSSTSNVPSTAGVLLNLKASSGRRFQLCVNSTSLWCRYGTSSQWYSWYKVTTTEVT